MKDVRLFWRNISLTGKITSLMVLLVLVSTLTLTAMSIQRERSNFRSELESQSDLMLYAVALNMRDSLYFLEMDELRSVADAIVGNENVESFVIYASDGSVLIKADLEAKMQFSQESDRLGSDLVTLESHVTYREWQTDQLISGRSVSLGNQVIGAVALGLSTKALDEKILAITRQGILLAMLTMLVGVGISILVVRQITTPLSELNYVAGEMTRGNTSIRANPQGRDEVGKVGEAFNQMAMSVQERETALREFAAELEMTIAERTAKLRQQAAMLEKMAVSDPLTRVFNRRHFFELAETEMERARRYNHPLGVILFDADYFKSINDTYGHPFGDLTLITIARTCEENIRNVDIFARYGGEEFILLMPQTDCESAKATAERLRKTIENTPHEHEGKTAFVTISIGVACYNPDTPMDFLDLVEQADQALYRSKQGGRNRVTLWQEKDEL